MEEYKSDIEEELALCTKSKFASIWNAVFPEERIKSDVLKNEELKEEFAQLILEELDFVEPDLFARIYNALCEEKISVEDLYK